MSLPGKKSHRSNPSGNCVRVGRMGATVVVWDDKDETRAPLYFAEKEWRDFIAGVKDGEFEYDELPFMTDGKRWRTWDEIEAEAKADGRLDEAQVAAERKRVRTALGQDLDTEE